MRLFIPAFLLLLLLPPYPAISKPSVLPVPRPAPDWVITEWINGQGKTLEELKGKVVVVDFFQLWCPGCNAFSVPLLKKWEQTFAKEIAAGHLKVISIHTVFEGHDFQNPLALKKYLKRKGIRHLVGVDRHQPGQRVPRTMRAYGTMGTPEMAIIDKNGIIQFQEFGGFDVGLAEKLLHDLLEHPFAMN